MELDFDTCYRILQSRERRHDGSFFAAVTSTRIYCRPSCPARLPLPANVRFYRSAAAAEGAGFRACRRCRPDAAPGSAEWRGRADTAARALRLIGAGALDRGGVGAVAARVSLSPRSLQRLLVAEVGASPLALARAQRAHRARLLMETTSMSAADVAFAAGFGSVRQFNETMAAVFGLTPGALRRSNGATSGGSISLRLAYRAPARVGDVLRFLGERSVAGMEVYDGATYRRTLRLPLGHGIAALRDGAGFVLCTLALEHLGDLGAAVAACRRLLDLDCDSQTVDEHLAADPFLAPCVAIAPGLRVPGACDGVEMAVRAVVGQQVSVAGARTITGRVAARCGDRLRLDDPDLTHVFPTAGTLAADGLEWLPMPGGRRAALLAVMQGLAAGIIHLDEGSDREAESAWLLGIRGIGPWTVNYLRMRALGDTDAFLEGDLGVRRGAEALGLTDPRALAAAATRWRPWRAYALQHLWNTVPAIAAATTAAAHGEDR